MHIDVYEEFLISEFITHIEKMISADTEDDELNGK